MSKTGETITFEYNEDGLRTKKTATSTGTTEYTLHGKRIVHMKNGTNEMHFFYGADDKPAVVVYNGTSYRYLYTLQGDVIGLVDGNGAWVVSYRFDAWGKPLGIGGSLGNTLGVLQPFRYRGYVYDRETGDYYLRSRYYRPEWGRFVSADILTGCNLYCYCGNETVSRKDTSGHDYVSTVEEMYRELNRYWSEHYVMPVSRFIYRARLRKGKVKAGYCSTLIDFAADQHHSSEGMSTMFREKSVVCGRTDQIGFENLPIGTIIGKMPNLGKGEFSPSDVVKGSNYTVEHGGIITDRSFHDGEWYITVRQAMTLRSGGGKIDEREYTIEQLKENGWNVFMWDKRVMPDEYAWLVREGDDGDESFTDFTDLPFFE